MRFFFKHVVLIFAALLTFSIIAFPQQSLASDPIGLTAETDLRIGIATIYSPDSFAAWGKIENSNSFSLRGQFWHSKISYGKFNARLGSELILTHRLNYPINGINGPEDSRIGIGFIPINILLPVAESKPVNPFAFFSAGGIFLNEKLPLVDGASINYLLNLGAGIELPLFSDADVQIGYSIQHMSNANTGEQNPGIDSHMFFISIILP